MKYPNTFYEGNNLVSSIPKNKVVDIVFLKDGTICCSGTKNKMLKYAREHNLACAYLIPIKFSKPKNVWGGFSMKIELSNHRKTLKVLEKFNKQNLKYHAEIDEMTDDIIIAKNKFFTKKLVALEGEYPNYETSIFECTPEKKEAILLFEKRTGAKVKVILE